MRKPAVLCALSAVMVGTLAQAAPDPSSAAGDVPPDAAALIESCSAHKFETIVRFTNANGKPRQSRVKLCGTAGQTDAQWAVTLRDAASKVRANESMAPEARDQVIAAIDEELAKLGPAATASAAATSTTTLVLPRNTGPTAAAAGPAGGLAEYSTLPPLTAPAPSPVTAAPAGARAAPAPTKASAPRPRLTIKCLLPADYGVPAACRGLESATLLVVRADENLAGGVQLRFLRRGDQRGEVKLAALRQGQTVQVRPPARLCAGVVRSSAQIEVVRAGAGTGEVVDTLGPFELRC